jgi:Flp pilus assembly protein TadD
MTRRAPLLSVALVAAAAAAGCATSSAGGGLRTNTYEARKKLAQELIARGELASAFAYADGLHREQPRDPEVLVLRGTVYRERGLFSDAEADLREAVDADGRSAEAHAALGILYDVMLKAELAEAEHRAANKLAPRNPGYLNNLGFSLFLRGKTAEAVGFFQQAARLDPTSRRVRTNLGFAYAAAGDLSRAAREFEMGGTPAEAKNNLGFAYERRGDLAHAFDLYAQAAHLDPQSTRAHANLVHAAGALGRSVPADVGTAPPSPSPSPLAERANAVAPEIAPAPTPPSPTKEDREP